MFSTGVTLPTLLTRTPWMRLCLQALIHQPQPPPPGQELVEDAVQRGGDGLPAALTAVAVWVRLSAARHLTWNRNYNVKPREISAAQV